MTYPNKHTSLPNKKPLDAVIYWGYQRNNGYFQYFEDAPLSRPLVKVSQPVSAIHSADVTQTKHSSL